MLSEIGGSAQESMKVFQDLKKDTTVAAWLVRAIPDNDKAALMFCRSTGKNSLKMEI